jgi:hypothetical protein
VVDLGGAFTKFEAEVGVQAQDAPQSLADAADNDPGVSRVFDREWASMLMREAGQLMYQRATEDKSCPRSVVAFHCVRTEPQLDDECRRLFDLLG